MSGAIAVLAIGIAVAYVMFLATVLILAFGQFLEWLAEWTNRY